MEEQPHHDDLQRSLHRDDGCPRGGQYVWNCWQCFHGCSRYFPCCRHQVANHTFHLNARGGRVDLIFCRYNSYLSRPGSYQCSMSRMPSTWRMAFLGPQARRGCASLKMDPESPTLSLELPPPFGPTGKGLCLKWSLNKINNNILLFT